jgi:hypothetical protein
VNGLLGAETLPALSTAPSTNVVLPDAVPELGQVQMGARQDEARVTSNT